MTAKKSPDVFGKTVICTICGLRKKPIGRYPPPEIANSLCDYRCPGYYEPPDPGYLWPNETKEEYGY